MKPVYLYMYESEEKGQKEKKRNTIWTLTIYVVISISYSLTHIKLLKINSGERNKRISHPSCSYGGFFFPRVTQQHSEISSSGSIDNVYYIICIYIYINIIISITFPGLPGSETKIGNKCFLLKKTNKTLCVLRPRG